MQFTDLPSYVIHEVLSLISPIELAACQLVNKQLNVTISESLILQYRSALALAMADNNPCSVMPLPQKHKGIRSSEAAWAALQPKFIASRPVKHRTSGIYDLSAGTFLLGNANRTALQYLQLPTRVGDPLDWRSIILDKSIIDVGSCVFEHDLIAIITSAPSTTQPGLLDIEMTLLEYSTGRPHPETEKTTVFIMCSSIRPTLTCKIVGENLVLVLNCIHTVSGENRVLFWNWRTSILKTALLAPFHTYSGILFLEEDFVILPNAKSAAFDFFRIPRNQTAIPPKPIFSLQLPSLADRMEINYITCRAEPNPIPDISRLNKRERPRELAKMGIDLADPSVLKRGFLARAEDAICIFQIHFRYVIQRHVNPHVGMTVNSYALLVHRSSFLKMAQHYEYTPNEAGVGLGPQIAWVDWGPPLSRWFSASTTRWITTSAGQRCVIRDDSHRRSPITILDFNQFNIRTMKAKLKRENETAKEDESWFIVTANDDNDIFVRHVPGDADSDYSMPSLESIANSDDESHTPLAGYATDTQGCRHPGHAFCRVFEAPSSVAPSGTTFAEEVEGRLPCIAYTSEREYEYGGVLMDEERVLGITVRLLWSPFNIVH